MLMTAEFTPLNVFLVLFNWGGLVRRKPARRTAGGYGGFNQGEADLTYPANPACPVKFENHFTGVNPACPPGGSKEKRNFA